MNRHKMECFFKKWTQHIATSKVEKQSMKRDVRPIRKMIICEYVNYFLKKIYPVQPV